MKNFSLQIQHLQWYKGPTIEIEQLGQGIYGEFRKANDPNILYLDIDLVNDLEASSPGSLLADSFSFLIGVTILHEAVHALIISHFRIDPLDANKTYPELVDDIVKDISKSK